MVARKEQGLLEHIKRRKMKKYRHWERTVASKVQMEVESGMKGRNRSGGRNGWRGDIKSWTGGLQIAREISLHQ